ncbi:MAG: hypothetical protein BWY60_00352 [Actinobacteria bacterium ADurb.Bin346]|nr:MAG: hypothetical protein BWY60_00352 [Actinobacteria bacterium ADurb.Bin346]
MEKLLIEFFENLELGQIGSFRNMSVVPLFFRNGDGPKYITMKDALENGTLIISEKNASGTVPELIAVNKGSLPVLLLDGEEVKGAKQNRMLNTTILLKEDSETVIPVSCTEQGRWSYTTQNFMDSDVVIAHKIRANKNISVHRSLDMGEKYMADQGKVWNDIIEYSHAADVASPTGAMRDVFEQKSADINDYLKSFAVNPDQKGIFVFIKGEIIGFDFISLASAYEKLHLKLLKSYAMDAILQKESDKKHEADPGKAKDMFEALKTGAEKVFDSIGYGRDHKNTVIHMACFRVEEAGGINFDEIGNIAGYRSRRNNRV